jgi:hypothetical protein
MRKYLERLPIDAFIYPERPRHDVAEHQNVAAITAWLRSEPASLPFDEVWQDMVQVLHHSPHLVTATGSGIEVKIEDVNSPALLIEAGERKHRYGPEDLLEFWQQLRGYGFTHRRIAPQENRFSYLMPVFERLPYVQRVEVSKSAEGLENNSAVALQVRPKARPSPPVGDLFSTVR